MVDLDVYRHRIGTFTSKLTSNKCQDGKVSCHLSREQRSRVKTVFTVLTVGLCLVLLGCQLEKQTTEECPSSPGTTCHKTLSFVRSVCEQYLHGELKGSMLDNVIKTLKFRNNFHLFYILTKEPKYQIHTGSTNYTPEVQIHADNTSYTPEVQIHVDNTSYTPEVQIHVDNSSYTPEVQIHVDNTSYTPEVQIHVDNTSYTPEVQIHVDNTSYTPEVQIHADNTSYTPEVQIHVDNTSYTPEVQIHVDNSSYTPEVQIHVDNTSYTPEVQIHVDNTSYTPEVQIHVDNTSYTPEVQIHVDNTSYTPEVQIHVDNTSYTPEVQMHVDNISNTPEVQIHVDNTSYTSEVQIHVDNTSYTPEVQIHVDNTSYTSEVQIHVDNASYTPEVQIHVDNTSYTPEVQIHVDNTSYTSEVQIHVDNASYTPEVQIHVDNTSYTPEVQIHVDNTNYTSEPVGVRLIVERHGTASYLLGNAGQHAYNGNPPKMRRDSDRPSISMDEEIKHLHYTMINELNDQLSSSMVTEWKAFTFVLRIYLPKTDIAGVTSMFEVCDRLETRGKIRCGEYDKLKKLFSTIQNQTCCDIVDKYLTQMKEVDTQHHRTQQEFQNQGNDLPQQSDRYRPSVSTTSTSYQAYDSSMPTVSEGSQYRASYYGVPAYTQPTQAYTLPNEAYTQPNSAYTLQNEAYSHPIQAFTQPNPVYTRPTSDYTPLNLTYSQPLFPTATQSYQHATRGYHSGPCTIQARLKVIEDNKRKLLEIESALLDTLLSCIKLTGTLQGGIMIEQLPALRKEYELICQLLEKFRREGFPLTAVQQKSIILSFHVAGTKALKKLWDVYMSGKLLNMLKEALITDFQLARCKVDNINLEVYMSEEDYRNCLKALDSEKSEGDVSGREMDISGVETVTSGEDDLSLAPDYMTKFSNKTPKEKCEDDVKGQETDTSGYEKVTSQVADVSFSPDYTTESLKKNLGRDSEKSEDDVSGRERDTSGVEIVTSGEGDLSLTPDYTAKFSDKTPKATGGKVIVKRTRRASSPSELKNEEAVRMSMFPSGKPPKPNEMTKIEREDWPGPPSPAAILPEIMRKRRKSRGEEEDDAEEKPQEDPKITKEIEEIPKFKDTSGIGSIIYKELAERKMQPVKALDPWKASRVPSAKYEPRYRTRLQLPMFASVKEKSESKQDLDSEEETPPNRKNRGRQKVHANTKSPRKPAHKNYPESDDEEEDDEDDYVPVKKSAKMKNTPKKKSKESSEEKDEEEEPRRKPTNLKKRGAKQKKLEFEYSEEDEEKVERKPKRRERRQQSDNEPSTSHLSGSAANIRGSYGVNANIIAGENVTVRDIGCQQTIYNAGPSKEPTDVMELVVKSWKEDDKVCYETKGVKAVKEKICNDSCVCVIGVPGSGKSTAIRHAALHLQKTSQYTIYPLDTPEEFDKYLDKDKEQVFVIDDTVGEHSVDKEKLGLWDRLNDRIKRCLDVSKNTKFLTSLRLQLYLDETLKGKTYIFNDADKKVNFSDKDFKLSLDDMKNMLRHYLEVRNVGNSEALIEDICGEEWLRWGYRGWAAKSADYFPLLCKVFSENESVRENPEKFFTDPFPALTDIFRQIKSENKHQFCGLLLCAFMELDHEYFSPHYPHDKPKIFTSLIESQKLDPEQDLDDIKNALHSLKGVYISHVANKYHFSHSTFRDITTFLYEDKYVIFQHAPCYFIKSRVRLFSKLSKDDDYVLVFHGEDCIELLVNRMIHELKCQTWWWRERVEFIVYNPYIDDERVVNALCTKLFDSQDTDITQDMVDRLFVGCMDVVGEYSVLHRDNRDEMSWPCYKLLVRLIPRVDCTREIEGVIYPVLMCVGTGSVSLTKLVVQQNSAMINAVDKFNCSVLHVALWCVNNVDMTRYLLSLPNLTCLNHRNRHGSPYWYVVHDRDIANRQEMMDIYKQAGAIALGD